MIEETMVTCRKKSRSILLVNASVLLFGAAGLFVKWILLPAIAITFGRVFLSAVTLFIFCSAQKQPLRIKERGAIAALFMAGAVLALHWSMFFLSIELSTVAIGTITFSAFPLFITFLEPVFFKERLLIRNIAAALFIMAGVIITIPQFSFENQAVLGIAAGMSSSLAYAALTLINRRLAKSQPSALIAFYEQAFAAVTLLPCLFYIKTQPSPQDIALLALLGVVMTALAHTLFISTLKHLTARTVGVISSLEAVYGIALALVLLGEIPSLREIAGGAVIIGAVIINQLAASD